MEAKYLSNHKLQLWFSRKGIDIAPYDGWTWAQYGDALLNLKMLNESLSAFDKAKLFGADVIAKTGHAEVLKTLNRLPEALEAYEAIIERYPEDVVARNGCSVILALMGDYQKALSYLGQKKPVTDNDWIGHHIKGMIYLNMRNLELSDQVFILHACRIKGPAGHPIIIPVK